MAAIGDDEQRERLLDQLGDPPGAQLGERGERALDEIGFGEKRLRGRRPGGPAMPTARRRQRSSKSSTPPMP
ncbi:MAG: hypothetical protein R3D28_10770 [Geminicoccaceae bacterium]